MSSAVLDRNVAPPSTAAHRRPTVRRLAIAGTALVLLGAGAWYARDWWNTGRFIETTDDAYVGGNVTPIAPHVAGFVQAVLVADHQHVRAGQMLIQLDPRDFQAALDHAQAVIAGKIAARDSLRAQLDLQRSIIAQQSADLSAKVAMSEYAQTDAARYRALVPTAAGSRQDAQRTAAVGLQASSAVLASTAALQAARQRMAVLAANITEADAAVAQAQSDEATAQLNRDYTQIRSPIDGYVGNRAAQLGAYVAAGGYLISVIPDQGLWVDANFKEDQLARMAPGRIASVTADILPGHTFHGHVASLAPGTGAVFSVIPPENATGNFTKIVQRVPVRITLDAGDAQSGLLRPGLSTTVRVDTRAAAAPAP